MTAVLLAIVLMISALAAPLRLAATELVSVLICTAALFRLATNRSTIHRLLRPALAILLLVSTLPAMGLALRGYGYTGLDSALYTLLTGSTCLVVLQVGLELNYVQRRQTILAFIVTLLLVLPGFWLLSTVSVDRGTVQTWPLANPNHTAVLYGIGAILAAGLLASAEGRQARAMGILAVALLLAPMLFCRSVLPPLVVCSALFWLAVRRQVPALPGFVQRILPYFPLLVVPALASVSVTLHQRWQIWLDTLAGLFAAGPISLLIGRGWGTFVADYTLWRSWAGSRPVDVLGPEGEWLTLLHASGLSGLITVGVALAFYPLIPLARKAGGGVRRAAVLAWLLLSVQAMMDNSLHQRPLLLLWFFLFGVAARRQLKPRISGYLPIEPPSTTNV